MTVSDCRKCAPYDCTCDNPNVRRYPCGFEWIGTPSRHTPKHIKVDLSNRDAVVVEEIGPDRYREFTPAEALPWLQLFLGEQMVAAMRELATALREGKKCRK